MSTLRDRLSSWKGPASELVLLFCVVSLLILGLVVLSSATQSFSRSGFFFNRQLIWLAIAIVVGLVASRVDFDLLRRGAPIIAALTLIGLLLTLIPGIGVEVNGARRWIDLKFMRLQYSEFAKLGMVIVLATYLTHNQQRMQELVRGFVIPSAWVGLVAFLILVEPDFGTAFLTGAVGMCLIFLAGARLIYLLPTVLMAGALFAVAIWHDPVRLARITSFLDVEANKADGAYQLWQGIIAFGVGGVDGVGLGNGRQQMAFLPESHTDFIFPIIGEELGLLFTGTVVMLFLTILVVSLIRLREAPNLFEFSLVSGAVFLLIAQAIINIGVVTGSLPTKGMSLPFISYGGSNLVLMAILVGFILNGFRRWSRPPILVAREIV